jgi:hypothetical protein
MTIAKWADFSSGRPGSAALKAAGISGVIRYVGIGSASKRITAAEYADYSANGIQVLLVFMMSRAATQPESLTPEPHCQMHAPSVFRTQSV